MLGRLIFEKGIHPQKLEGLMGDFPHLRIVEILIKCCCPQLPSAARPVEAGELEGGREGEEREGGREGRREGGREGGRREGVEGGREGGRGEGGERGGREEGSYFLAGTKFSTLYF